MSLLPLSGQYPISRKTPVTVRIFFFNTAKSTLKLNFLDLNRTLLLLQSKFTPAPLS